MAQALRSVEDETPQTALVAQVNADPGLVLLDQVRFDQFYEAIKAETEKLDPDTTSEKGRAAIKAMAFKVTKTKTAIDAAGKLLKEEAQQTVNKVDAARREIKGRLEGLAVEVRKPLTAWEAAEDARLATVKEVMDRLQSDGSVSADETVADVEARLGSLRALTFDDDVFQDWAPLAATARGNAVQLLETALTRLQREAADRAELDRLRAEAATRAEQDRQREEAAEAERHRVDYVARLMKHITDAGNGTIGGETYPFPILLRELEEKVVADDYLGADRERVEAHRIETLALLNQRFKEHLERAAAEREAAEALRLADAAAAAKDEARLAAETRAHAEREAADLVHAEALAAEKRRADLAENDARIAADHARMVQEENERAARLQQEAADARAADIEHRSKIMGTAKVAIMGMGVGEQAAIGIVRAIAAGDVPNVSIRF